MPFEPGNTYTLKIELGTRYHRLIVIERAGSNNAQKALWRCRCDCGNETITLGARLRSGHTKSCGCAQIEFAKTLKGLSLEEKIKRKTQPRECSRCYTIKPPEEFSEDGRRHHCKQCQKDWAREHIEKKGGYGIVSILNKYGLTLNDFNEIKARQDGKCAICLEKPTSRPLNVDHDHSMERNRASVRGLLCGRCNTGLGMLRDNIDLLKSAISYLEAWNMRFTKVSLDNA